MLTGGTLLGFASTLAFAVADARFGDGRSPAADGDPEPDPEREPEEASA